MIDIRIGDCLEVMPTLPENSVDSIITDPPYGLEFMGKDWDHGVPGVEFWQAALRVAKPGATLLCFGGDRTHHRLMVAIEDAGWEIRTCMYWAFGSGFPKSLDISKAMSRMVPASSPAEVMGKVGSVDASKPAGLVSTGIGTVPIAVPFAGLSTNGADGHGPHSGGGSLGGQSEMKCGVELLDGQGNPIVLGSPDVTGLAESDKIVGGVGVIQIQPEALGNQVMGDKVVGGSTVEAGPIAGDNLTGHDMPTLPHIGVSAAAPNGVPIPTESGSIVNGHAGAGTVDGLRCFPSDGLSASPTDECVVHNSDYTTERQSCQAMWRGWGTALKPAVEIIVVAMKPLEGTYAENAQKWGVAGLNIDGARIEGPKGSGVWGSSNKTCQDGRTFNGSPDGEEYRSQQNPQGRWPANLLLDEESAPLLGGASRFFYTAKASSSERNAGLEDRNGHPTIKPIDLMRYLCKLTRTPTGGVVLDPFMGSGTTGIACILEHRDFIGIEISAEYAEIAKKRIADMEGPLFSS
jgi:hypothetical protein